MGQKWFRAVALSLLIGVSGAVSPGLATETDGAEPEQQVGAITHLPLPRYVSMKASKGNARRGPSVTHRIDWVFMRRNMPLQITAEHGHWRRVVDQEGVGGWIHHSLLSGVRTVLIQKDMLDIHARPNDKSPVTAQLELGVVARLDQCLPDWCRLQVAGFKGWAPKTALWGVDRAELRD
ncbi:SH3 domain-containing protein [Pseudooceanicola sp. MF1-13]|uniref:SH3 domain-containing protein n=1 Tax=Pseudooceanicola sp. MF1-13 TaxID=3379095 RepID=UPI003891E8A5